MKRLAQKVSFLLFIIITFSCSSCKEENFEPENAKVISCLEFKFDGIEFQLPNGRCSQGNQIEYSITENGESYKFNIICDGSCIESAETTE